jgi:stage V sporulation protein G
MEITDVKVIPVDDEKLKAFVSIVFDQSFVVTDIKIINGPKGLFVSMPSKKRKDGTFKDIAHPLNNQMRQYVEDKILTVYRQQVAGGPSALHQSAAPAASDAPGRSAQGGTQAEGPSTGGGAPGQGGSGRPGSGSGSEGNGGSGGEAPRS